MQSVLGALPDRTGHMTQTMLPSATPARPRHGQENTLNPLRYHAMINSVRIPQPAPIDEQPRRFRRGALLSGLLMLILGVAALVFGPSLVQDVTG